MMRRLLVVACTLGVVSLVAAAQNDAPPGAVVSLPSAGALYEIQIMIRAGSADDPADREGTAQLTGRLLVEGGFGDSANPVTKERLAEITRPWGSGAMPSVGVGKQTTSIAMTVPRDVFPEYVARIIRPMLQQPLWQPAELDRLRREVLATVESRLPFEQQEELGLEGLDNYIFVGTPLQHLAQGTVDGLKAAGRDDLANFARRYYTRDNMYVASTISDEKHLGVLLDALPAASVEPPPRRVIQVHPVKGRELLILTQASAIASGIHAGFPTEVTRSHADYWPLFVGNVFFGTHRDSFGRLYTLIREERGYNYGNYSYIEYLAGRPAFQFPLPGTPRTHQYFSIWIRPVAHQYVHFLTKGFMFELERLLRDGLTSREVAEARIKARTLYLNYAASKDRQLGYRLDDLFYGMRGSGYLQEMLHRIDAVTADEVNGALRRHLQAANMKFLIVTHPDQAGRLADDIAGGRPAAGKTREEYHIGDPVPAEKRALLERDRQWAAYPLAIARDRIRIVKSEELFRSANR